MAKIIHAGEQNIIDNVSLQYNDNNKVLEHYIAVGSADSGKYCTAKSITERVGELGSAKGTHFYVVVDFQNEFNEKDYSIQYAYESTISEYKDKKHINNVTVQYRMRGKQIWGK